MRYEEPKMEILYVEEDVIMLISNGGTGGDDDNVVDWDGSW